MPDLEVEDRRVRRTRQALNEALIELVLEGPYDDIQVADIIARAEVGRSTFYQHYSNKDDLLRQSLAGAFEALAEIVGYAYDPSRLEFWATEFWNNRKVGRILLSGQTRPFLNRQLGQLIEAHLTRLFRTSTGAPVAPPALVAMSLAQAQLGLIHAWQMGTVASTPAAIAETLRRLTAGAVAGLYKASEG